MRTASTRSKAVLGTLVLVGLMAAVPVLAAEDEDTWEGFKPRLYGDRAVQEDATFVTLVAPTRAEDAALVPIDLHISVPDADKRDVVALTVVVDENPSPLVTTLRLGEGGGRHFDFSTRVRVNSYSFVRVIAETSDGTLHMAKSFVKAAGGCSAPAVKDPNEAKAEAGRMRFRVFSGTGRDEAQLQIRHPNYSGMQMNQLTRLYTPAWFVRTVAVNEGDHLLFSMENGISLSEDPTFRFTYRSTGRPVSVQARDSDDTLFKHDFNGDGGT